MNSPIIGLDLGGTNIKAVLTSPNGKVSERLMLASEAEHGPEHVIGRLELATRRLCDNAGVALQSVAGIGVGCPGPLNSRSGVVIHSANLPGWRNVPIRDLVQQRTGRPTVLINDANAAAFGEYWGGAGKGADDLILLTFGTGVGGGVILSGVLLEGHSGNAGELGHMIVYPGGRACRCGQSGCLEAFAGNSYLIEQAVRVGVLADADAGDAADIVAAAGRGVSAAVMLWEQCCEAIALACVNLQHAFNPQRILLGGGMAAAGDKLLDPVRRFHRELTWRLADDIPEFALATLGNDAGAVGAAGWFLKSRASH